ncbi:MAG TPA: glycosyltransferase family 4 protein [Candidatus Bathyarchaeia archaeon]|nr:glycosyltransferase family 4 protein [Candidatus Bathyarchaeia archaeon]
MKSWAVKLGKGIGAIKRDGVWRGGKRAAGSFFKLFRKVGSGDILFISSGVGDSARYRSDRQAEELSLHGFKCSVTVQDNPLLPRYADRFKIFIFQKTIFSKPVARLIEKIKAQKKEIIFETDDLVYDPEYIRQTDFFRKMNALEKKQYETGVGSEILNNDYTKTCVTATSFLADKLRQHGKQVFISKNKLANYDVEVGEKILEGKIERGDEKIRIGYFSGTASHDKDFETVKEALKYILEKHPQVELHLFGPLEFDDVYAKYDGRVKKHPFASWERHLENIASVDVNISPLEVGNPFCESKSELKFIEASIVSVPTVAAATRTFKEAIEDGVDGFFAGNTEEWIEKLEKLILNGDLRRQMGEIAREKVLENYTNKNSRNEEYYDFLKSKLKYETSVYSKYF